MDINYFVYILANWRGNILYTGVTNDLMRRMWEHKNLPSHSYAWKYNINKLVYYEIHTDITWAIAREKVIKGGSRKKKVALISCFNPAWKDLFGDGRTLLRRPFGPPRNDREAQGVQMELMPRSPHYKSSPINNDG